jgi:hypothetical protein
MIVAQNLPEFLWEHAVAHAVYIRNRSYSRTLQGEKTPYELWQNKKPSVAHLREFGAPVWILLQGQAEQRKLQPKSKRRAFVGYEDGPKAVKYYTAEQKKVLTSRNYRFLSTPTAMGSPSDEIVVAPDGQREGETEEGALSSGIDPSKGEPSTKTTEDHPERDGARSKRKRGAEEESESEDVSPRKTRGICTDYRKLQDPFTHCFDGIRSTEEDEINVSQTEAMLGGDDPKSLRQAKESPQWPEWEHAVQAELDQLQNTGTWSLV